MKLNSSAQKGQTSPTLPFLWTKVVKVVSILGADATVHCAEKRGKKFCCIILIYTILEKANFFSCKIKVLMMVRKTLVKTVTCLDDLCVIKIRKYEIF